MKRPVKRVLGALLVGTPFVAMFAGDVVKYGAFKAILVWIGIAVFVAALLFGTWLLASD